MSAVEKLETDQFLTFALAGDIFAIDVTMAREVLDVSVVTRVPQMPAYVLGVINLRGAVVPVIDMRLKFGLDQVARTRDTCIVVVEILIDDAPVQMGMLVDSVCAVMDLDASCIEPPPRIGSGLNAEFIRGMGNLGDRFVIILELDKVLAAEGQALIQEHGVRE